MILLAEARQTSLSEAGRELYIRQLKGYDSRDVERAIQEMAIEPREPFQPAFPDLGTIIARIVATRDQRTRPRATDTCGKCFSGYLIFNEDGSPHHRVRDAKRDTFARECECLSNMRAEPAADRKTVAAGA